MDTVDGPGDCVSAIDGPDDCVDTVDGPVPSSLLLGFKCPVVPFRHGFADTSALLTANMACHGS